MKKMLTLAIVVCIMIAASTGLYAHQLSHKFQYVSPLPNAELVTKETTIILRTGEYLSAYDISKYQGAKIVGSVSGNHDFETIASSDGETAILKPYFTFEAGEKVTVTFRDGTAYSFTISPKTQPLLTESEWKEVYYDIFSQEDIHYQQQPQEGLALDRDVSLPSDFPPITVTINNNPAPGYVFMNSIPGVYPSYIMIVENDGTPIYYQKMSLWSFDFKKQHGYLTYNKFPQPRPGVVHATFYAMNQTYTVIDSFKCGNGYYAFPADMDLSVDFHALMISYDPQTVDMSGITPGGDTAATVVGLIVQEIDSLKNVVFQWRSWDHFEITDATFDINLLAPVIDYVHGNSVDWDADGNITISCRHMDEVTKIDRTTGNIIWRLGGIYCENNMFTFVSDSSGFSHQHDFLRLDNGNYTVYDNGNLHSPQFSRAVEYELDTLAMTCTQVWEFRDSPDLYGSANGNVQRLPNGNTFICWGKTWPNMVEVQSDGTKEHELTLPTSTARTFKAYRFPWTGIASVPYLVVENVDDGFHLIFNKFGDYPDWYKIYMDTIPNPTTAIDSTINTYYDVTDVDCGKTYYFRVTAIDYTHFESDYSNEESGTVQIAYLPGDSNADDIVMGSDVIFSVNYFKGGTVPSITCWNDSTGSEHFVAADANGDCRFIGSDITFMVNYFKGGTAPTYCPQTPPFEE